MQSQYLRQDDNKCPTNVNGLFHALPMQVLVTGCVNCCDFYTHKKKEMMSDQAPIANGKEFFFSMVILGEMSVGKSTLVNSIFGDILAEAGLDQTTMAPHRFYESPEIKHNKSMWYHNQQSRMANKSQQHNIKQKAEWKKQQKEFDKKWFKNWRINEPKFSEFPIYKIKTSDIVRHNEGENLFHVLDLPGLNDAKANFDKEIWKVINAHGGKFDLLIYVVECAKGVNIATSKDYFNIMIRNIKDLLQNNLIKLIIVFNKFDLIEVRKGSRESLFKMQERMCGELIDKLGKQVVNNNISMYNIAANRLLVERVIKDNDIQCIENVEGLMDDIHDYCLHKFSFNTKQLNGMEDLSVKDQMKIIGDEMAKTNENEDENKDEYKNNQENKAQVEEKDDRQVATLEHVKHKRENSKELKQAFRDMRNLLSLFDKIITFIKKKFNTDQGHLDESKCKEMFDPIEAILRFIEKNQNNVMKNDERLKSFVKEFGHLLNSKMTEWFNTFQSSKAKAKYK